MRHKIVPKKIAIPILSTTGLSFCSCFPAFLFSRASIGTTGVLGVNFGPINNAQRGTIIRIGQVPMVKSTARILISVNP